MWRVDSYILMMRGPQASCIARKYRSPSDFVCLFIILLSSWLMLSSFVFANANGDPSPPHQELHVFLYDYKGENTLDSVWLTLIVLIRCR